MTAFEDEKRKNLAAYEEIKDEIRAKYKGQYVAIAGGSLVKVSPNFDEADSAVKNFVHSLVFPVEEEPVIGPLRVRVGKHGGLFG